MAKSWNSSGLAMMLVGGLMVAFAVDTGLKYLAGDLYSG